MKNLFKGVCPVINTPFSREGDIDYTGIGNIIEYVLAAGCESLAVFALNSEPHKLTFKEKESILDCFLKTVNGRASTMVGIVENSLRGAIELALFAEKLGAAGIILYPPSLVTPADGQLLGYFKKIAEQVKLPVVIQDAPRTTGVSMSTEFILNAFDQIENFKFIKVECPLPVHKINRIVHQTRHGLRCFSGNGGIFTVDAFIRGAWGVMPGVGIIRQFVNIYDAYISNDITKARDIFENILPLLWFEDQSLEFFIACEKEILSKQGVIDSTYIRAPKFALDSESLTELNILYDRLKAL